MHAPEGDARPVEFLRERGERGLVRHAQEHDVRAVRQVARGGIARRVPDLNRTIDPGQVGATDQIVMQERSFESFDAAGVCGIDRVTL